jgi:hypothetical protein
MKVWIFKVLLGFLFLNSVFAGEFVYYIGSYGDEGNFDFHERNFHTIKKELFPDKKIRIINATGNKTKIIPHDENGVQLKGGPLPTTISDDLALGGVKPSSKKALQSTFTEVGNSASKNVTLIFDDHAAQGYISTKKREDGDEAEYLISPDFLKDQKNQLLSKNLTRSIHLHCYAGSLLGGSRNIPSSTSGALKYLKEEFPKNHCALATSHDYELGQYMNAPHFLKDQDTNIGLKKIFSKDKPLTLKKLHENFKTDPNWIRTPILTSERYLETFGKILCRELDSSVETIDLDKDKSLINPGLLCPKDLLEHMINPLPEEEISQIANVREILAKNNKKQFKELRNVICNNPLERALSMKEKTADRLVLDEYELLFRSLKKNFIQGTVVPGYIDDPEKMVKQASQYLKEKSSADAQGIPYRNDELRKAFETYIIRYENLEKDRDFKKFKNQKNAEEYITSNLTYLDSLGKIDNLKKFMKKKNLTKYEDLSVAMQTHRELTTGKQDKAIYKKHMEKLKGALLPLIEGRGSFSPIKEHYEALTRCENSTLD